MLTKSSVACITSLFALLIGCSQSAATGGEGGSSTGSGGESTGSGGSTASNNGGSSTSSNGGATTQSNGGSNASNGGSSTQGSGGSTASNNGGSSTSNNGGSSTSSNGGSSTSNNGGSSTSNNGGSDSGGANSAGSNNGGSSNGGSSTNGSGGASTAGSSSLACPDGCAQLSVPFATGAWDTKQQFEIYLANTIDLTSATITVKLRKIAGKAGGVQVLVKDGSPDYQWAQSDWFAISDLSETDFVTKSFVVASPSSSDTNHTFDPTKVAIITVQINAGAAWYTDPPTNSVEDPTALVSPTVIQLDEVAITGVSGTVPGPFGFDTAANTSLIVANLDANGLSPAQGKPWAIAGSSVTFVGP